MKVSDKIVGQVVNTAAVICFSSLVVLILLAFLHASSYMIYITTLVTSLSFLTIAGGALYEIVRRYFQENCK